LMPNYGNVWTAWHDEKLNSWNSSGISVTDMT
jgi:hypothetical protein